MGSLNEKERFSFLFSMEFGVVSPSLAGYSLQFILDLTLISLR